MLSDGARPGRKEHLVLGIRLGFKQLIRAMLLFSFSRGLNEIGFSIVSPKPGPNQPFLHPLTGHKNISSILTFDAIDFLNNTCRPSSYKSLAT